MSTITGGAGVTDGSNVTGEITTSVYNFLSTPNVLDVFANKYGEQSARLMLELAGRVVPIQGYDSSNPLTLHENENRIHEAITGTPGASSTSEITVTGVSSTDACQKGQSCWIEATDGDLPEFIITSVDSDTQIKIKAFKDEDPSISTSEVTIYLGPNNGGEGSGQPDSTSTDMTSHTFKPFEAKETVTLTSDALAKKYYFEELRNGYRTVYFKEMLESEGRMNIREDMKAMFGEQNTNSVTVSTESGTTNAHSSEGWWQIIDRLGGKLDYGNDFAIEYLDEIESFMESYHVNSKNFTLMGGSGLGRKINKVGLDFVQQFSSGSDFVQQMFQGNEEMAAKANIKVLQYGDITLAFKPLNIFNDPTQMGNVLNNSGILFPMTNVADPATGDVWSNIGLGYTKKGDQSLKRIVNKHPGMTQDWGVVSSQYSKDSYFLRSQLTPFLLGGNQMLLVRDQ